MADVERPANPDGGRAEENKKLLAQVLEESRREEEARRARKRARLKEKKRQAARRDLTDEPTEPRFRRRKESTVKPSRTRRNIVASILIAIPTLGLLMSGNKVKEEGPKEEVARPVRVEPRPKEAEREGFLTRLRKQEERAEDELRERYRPMVTTSRQAATTREVTRETTKFELFWQHISDGFRSLF